MVRKIEVELNMKTAVVLGSTGQDGSFLVGELLARGFKVICGVRKSSGDNLLNLREYMDDVKHTDHLVLEEFDLSDSTSLYGIIATWKPDGCLMKRIKITSDGQINFPHTVSKSLQMR